MYNTLCSQSDTNPTTIATTYCTNRCVLHVGINGRVQRSKELAIITRKRKKLLYFFKLKKIIMLNKGQETYLIINYIIWAADGSHQFTTIQHQKTPLNIPLPNTDN